MRDNINDAEVMGKYIDWELTNTKNVSRTLNEKFINLQLKQQIGTTTPQKSI